MILKILNEDMNLNKILDIINNPKEYSTIYQQYSDGYVDRHGRLRNSDIIANSRSRSDLKSDNNYQVIDDAFDHMSVKNKRKFIEDEFLNQYPNVDNLKPGWDTYIKSILEDGFDINDNPLLVFIDKIGNSVESLNVSNFIATFLRSEFKDKYDGASPEYQWLYNPSLYKTDKDKDILWKINTLEYFEDNESMEGKDENGNATKITLTDLLNDKYLSDAKKMRQFIEDAKIVVNKKSNSINKVEKLLIEYISKLNIQKLKDELEPTLKDISSDKSRQTIVNHLLYLLNKKSGIPESSEVYSNYQNLLDYLLNKATEIQWNRFLDISLNDNDVKDLDKDIWRCIKNVLDKYQEQIQKNDDLKKANKKLDDINNKLNDIDSFTKTKLQRNSANIPNYRGRNTAINKDTNK